MVKYKTQIGMPFDIDGEEYIYAGKYKSDGYFEECEKCGKARKIENMHMFVFAEDWQLYTKTTDYYVYRLYGQECARKIIGAGYGS